MIIPYELNLFFLQKHVRGNTSLNFLIPEISIMSCKYLIFEVKVIWYSDDGLLKEQA